MWRVGLCGGLSCKMEFERLQSDLNVELQRTSAIPTANNITMISDIDELAAAAWKAPFSMSHRAAIFSPFGGFCWMSNPPERWYPDPVGKTPTEAQNVAWLMTCAARADSPKIIKEAAVTLGFVTHLQREGSIARSMYRRLATRSSELVTIAELEEELRSSMEPVAVFEGGQVQRIDPYFWSILDRIVRDSTTQYLEGLDVTLSQMKGLEALQLSAQINGAMERVRRATSHELSRALLSRSTSADIVTVLSSLRNEFCAQHVGMVKDHMRHQLKWLRALSWLAAADASDIEQNLSTVEHDLEMLVKNPPMLFQEYLQSRGSSLSELSMCYGNRGTSLIDQTSIVKQPSSGVRATMVARWLEQQGVLVGEACASCISVFNRLLDQPPTSMCWNGIELCRDDPSDPRTRAALGNKPRHHADAGSLVQHQPPRHLACGGTLEARVLVYTQTDVVIGLRCARFFSVLLEQATLGLLPPLTLQAGVLLPLVSRFTAEHEAQYVASMEGNLRPVAEQCSHRWPEDDYTARRKRHLPDSPIPSASSSEDGEVAPTVATVLVHPQTMRAGSSLSSQLVEQANVPPKLLRDHAIVHAFCKCLQARFQTFTHLAGYSQRIGLDQITTMVRAVAPALATQADGSLKQAVSYVIKTVLSRAQSRDSYPYAVEGQFVYIQDRDRKAGGQVIGLLMDAPGRAGLLKFATWVVMQMSQNGAAYLKEWKPSRSAQSHATTVARAVYAAGPKRAKATVTAVAAVAAVAAVLG